jgi:hypothetical protein
MMVGAGVIFAEVCMHEGVVWGLVIDPEEEKLSWLQVGLEFERSDFKGDSFRG